MRPPTTNLAPPQLSNLDQVSLPALQLPVGAQHVERKDRHSRQDHRPRPSKRRLFQPQHDTSTATKSAQSLPPSVQRAVSGGFAPDWTPAGTGQEEVRLGRVTFLQPVSSPPPTRSAPRSTSIPLPSRICPAFGQLGMSRRRDHQRPRFTKVRLRFTMARERDADMAQALHGLWLRRIIEVNLATKKTSAGARTMMSCVRYHHQGGGRTGRLLFLRSPSSPPRPWWRPRPGSPRPSCGAADAAEEMLQDQQRGDIATREGGLGGQRESGIGRYF